METFGEWLQDELDRQGITQADLARSSGLSTATVSRIITDSRNPGMKALTAIARGLRLPPELVYQKANIFSASLPPDARIDPLASELATIFLKLSELDRDTVLTLARHLYARQ